MGILSVNTICGVLTMLDENHGYHPAAYQMKHFDSPNELYKHLRETIMPIGYKKYYVLPNEELRELLSKHYGTRICYGCVLLVKEEWMSGMELTR